MYGDLLLYPRLARDMTIIALNEDEMNYRGLVDAFVHCLQPILKNVLDSRFRAEVPDSAFFGQTCAMRWLCRGVWSPILLYSILVVIQNALLFVSICDILL